MSKAGRNGGEKTGGRAKGKPNRDRENLLALSEKLGVDPFEVLLLFAKGDWHALGYKSETYVSGEGKGSVSYKYFIDPSVRAKSASEACQYLFAKRKTVEVEAPNGLDVNLKTDVDPKVLSDLLEAKECLSELKKS